MEPRDERARQEERQFRSEAEEARKKKLVNDTRREIRVEAAKKRDRFEKEKFATYLNVINKAEFSDPVRKSDRPITRADIAEVQMDLVNLGLGRDIDEKF